MRHEFEWHMIEPRCIMHQRVRVLCGVALHVHKESSTKSSVCGQVYGGGRNPVLWSYGQWSLKWLRK